MYIRHVYVVVFSASPASWLVGGADQSEAATEREGEGRREGGEGVATRPALNMAEQRLRSAVPLYLTCLYETKRHGEWGQNQEHDSSECELRNVYDVITVL